MEIKIEYDYNNKKTVQRYKRAFITFGDNFLIYLSNFEEVILFLSILETFRMLKLEPNKTYEFKYFSVRLKSKTKEDEFTYLSIKQNSDEIIKSSKEKKLGLTKSMTLTNNFLTLDFLQINYIQKYFNSYKPID